MKKVKEEGHYTIKRIDKLPEKGNANFLYAIKGPTIEKVYRAIPEGGYETITIGDPDGGKTYIQQGDKITISGTGVITDPYIVNGAAYTLTSITDKSFDLLENGTPVSTIGLNAFPEFVDLYTGNAVLEGGVIYDSITDTYYVWATKYIIDGTFYNGVGVSGYVTLPDGDGSNARIDVFKIINNGVDAPSVGSEQGLADGLLVEPNLDLTSEVKVGFKIISVGETVPADITDFLVYDENLTEPTEWTKIAIAGGDPADITDPFNGTVSYDIPSPGSLAFTYSSNIGITVDTQLVWAMKTDSSWGGNNKIRVTIEREGVEESSQVTITRNNGSSFNFNHNNTGVWQLVSIPRGLFTYSDSEINRINFDFQNTPGLKIDRVLIQNGIAPGVTAPTIEKTSDIELNDGATGVSPYVEVVDLGPDPTGFEAINEGNGLGWTRVGRIAANYGNVGFQSTDATYSTGASSTRGVTGNYAFGFGFDTTAAGNYSFVSGEDNTAGGDYSFTHGYQNSVGFFSQAFGEGNVLVGYTSFASGTYQTEIDSGGGSHYNHMSGQGNYLDASASVMMGAVLEQNTPGQVVGMTVLGMANAEVYMGAARHDLNNPLLVIGNGTINTPSGLWTAITRSNAVELLRNGIFRLPSTTIAIIDTEHSASGRQVPTTEWVYSKIAAVGGVRKKAVIDYVDNTAVPPTEVTGDRYILDDTGASDAAWDGAAALDIVEFNGTVWTAETPEEGWVTYVDLLNVDFLHVDDGTPAWEAAAGAASLQAVTDVGNTTTLNIGVLSVNALTLNAQTGISVDNIRIGIDSGLNNTGVRAMFMGTEAGRDNTGNDSTMLGYFAGAENVQSHLTAVGGRAGEFNKGRFVTALGTQAAWKNIGENIVAIGSTSATAASGGQCVFVGKDAGPNTSGDGSTYIGYQVAQSLAADGALLDVSDASTDVDTAQDRITLTAHGLGANGTKRVMRYTTTGTPIAGLSAGAAYPITIIDVNTIEFSSTDITSNGTDIHTFQSFPKYDNVTVLGSQALPTKSNQVVLGDDNVTEVYTDGALKSGAYGAGTETGDATYDLAVDVDGKIIESKVSCKTFVALINQTGTNAPTVKVLENSLGFTPTFGYSSVGIYSISGTFPVDKVWHVLSPFAGTTDYYEAGIVHSTASLMTINTNFLGAASNDILVDSPIEIRIYS